MATRVRLDDWEAAVDELRRFGKPGEVTTGDDWIRLDFGSAQVEVTQGGRVSTGMALHEFEREGEVELLVDHDEGTLAIETDDVGYTFRRPGG
ncbi:hypothetical protein [Natronorubrum texcoconense]|uniref:Uncharacterized protein n=1 Tax=Natronorubrum texcoconense TaxID=1095776 RepID=A0A1G8XVV4_9EURY|nr:hypothetical protein [Natronorubrum texcoconense]SDJ94678.1 hypothetical protein SAMN04515672_1923 [Natronorubrum texcoconense]